MKTRIIQKLQHIPYFRDNNRSFHLSDEDLIEYVYQHVKFAETMHIEYGLYGNLEVSVAFEMHIHQESGQSQIEDTNTAYMHNLGRPINEEKESCKDVIRT